MRVDCTNHEFPHKEAQLLADLTVVDRDFERVLELLAPLRIGETWQNLKWDETETRWNCAVIRYMRAFSDGLLSWGWQDALASLDEKALQTHEGIRAERNKYIAHSVNGFEEAMPVVQICVGDDGSVEIRGVHCSSGRIIGAPSGLVDRFHALVMALRAVVGNQLELERQRLLKIALEIGAEDLRKGDAWRFDRGESSLHRPRKKLPGLPKRN